MRKFYLLSALVLLFGCQQGEGRSGKSDLHRNWHYVVAVDSSTASDPAWTKVVDTLVAKYKAKTLTYADVSKINDLLPELKSISPRYVCFVSKPEMAGRELIVEAAQLLRHIDDDPYGDAIWGVVTPTPPTSRFSAHRRWQRRWRCWDALEHLKPDGHQ